MSEVRPVTPSNHINKIWPEAATHRLTKQTEPTKPWALWLEVTSALSNYISSFTYLDSFLTRDFSSSLASFMLFMS